jgi:hypothetical protein
MNMPEPITPPITRAMAVFRERLLLKGREMWLIYPAR